MQQVEINGVNDTFTWSNRMPARIDGKYYIYYAGAYPPSHLDVSSSRGSAGSVPVPGVTVSPISAVVDAVTGLLCSVKKCLVA